MPRTLLTDEYWSKLLTILLDLGIYHKKNLRQTVEGILYRLRTGIPWEDIPPSLGKANSLLRTFHRWSARDIFKSILNALSEFPDMEWVFVDGSHVKVHQHATATVGETAAVGHSRGGNTTKIHLAVDANGNPAGFKITPGTVNDITAAPELLDEIDLSSTEVLTADKGYDSDAFRQQLADRGVKPNIPYRRDRERLNVSMDWYLYKTRHLVENAFEKLKNFRAVATRYDRLKKHYESTVALACIVLWLPL
ncbi:MAG: IS5 family transposase [Neisseria sp.]|nr:IS5 family transposase [Neisseria sp.]